MSMRDATDMTFRPVLALESLGRQDEANAVSTGIYRHSELESIEAGIDFFVTSLPAMLPFIDQDLAQCNRVGAPFLRVQVLVGMKDMVEAQKLIQEVLSANSGQRGAFDLCYELSRTDEAGPTRL